MGRFFSLWGLSLSLCLAGTVAAAPEVGSNNVASEVSLQDQLEKSLRARRPSEFRFIAKIVAQVDNGDLPRDLVQSSFNWARRRPSKKVQYFEQALRRRAKRGGITLATDGATTLR
jgi:hypothetical protein